MSAIVSWIDFFNRKERYLLIRQALGGFTLGEEFGDKLSGIIGDEIPFPPKTRTYMDYHFDWIYAALQLAEVHPDPALKLPVFPSPDFRFPDDPRPAPIYVGMNQEDVDLLVAYVRDGRTHLLMVEAKAETPWSSRQFRSKMNRLRVIFDVTAPWYRPDVIPHFVLASPREPQKLKVEPWYPEWAMSDGKPRWLKLDPFAGDRMVVERWNDEIGLPSKGAATWHPRPVDPHWAVE